ncbi:MAG: hypothetical protein HY553_16780 [Elusimicrobia bacterium]|nr:hypothetical protein [Elusimicrobiota bacterium]
MSTPRSSRRVRLLEPAPRPPVTAVERYAIAMLGRAGVMSWATLIDRLAGQVYADALRHGAWAVDIGVFGSALFVADVALELEAGNGVLWAIETPDEAR